MSPRKIVYRRQKGEFFKSNIDFFNFVQSVRMGELRSIISSPTRNFLSLFIIRLSFWMPHFELLENLIYMILLSWSIILLYHHGVVSRKKLVFIFIPNSDVENWINHPQITAYNIYLWIPERLLSCICFFVSISLLPSTKGIHSCVFGLRPLKLFHHMMNMLSVLVYLTFLNWVIEVRRERKKKELIRCSNTSFNRQTFMRIVGCCLSKYLHSSLIRLFCVIPYGFYLLM